MEQSSESATGTGRNRVHVVTARTFLARSHDLAGESGVYGLLFRNGAALLQATDYQGPSPFEIGEFAHLYTGASYEIGKRILRHLVGNAISSNLRETLFAIDMYMDGAVRESLLEVPVLTEAALTDWMLSNTLVAYKRCLNPADEETSILNHLSSPLNIDKKRPDPYARRLMALRCALRGSPVPQWCWESAADLLAAYMIQGEEA